MSRIACDHKDTISDNGESVCSRCGVIVSECGNDSAGAADMITSNTSNGATLSLYQRHAKGTGELVPRMAEMKSLDKFFHHALSDKRVTEHGKTLSRISNCCTKLELGHSESEYVRNTFFGHMASRCENDSNDNRNNDMGRTCRGGRAAETVCWAIRNACKVHGMSIDDSKIIDVVKMEFGRTTMPSMMKIIYKFAEIVSPEADDRYYFRYMIRRLLGGSEYGKSEYARMERMAWHLFCRVYVDGSPSVRARKAITSAFGLGR